MSTTPDESALQELTNRLAKLEQANADLQEKLATIQAERAIAGEQPIPHRPGPPPPGPPAAFSSALAGIPAVDAIGTQGADGIDASSDSGTAVSGISTDGTGVVAQSTNFLGLQVVGGGATFNPPPSFPMAIYAQGGPGTGIYAESQSTAIVGFGGSVGVGSRCDVGIGVDSISHDGIGVKAHSINGFGIDSASSNSYGISSKGGDIGVYAQNLTNTGNAVYLGTRALGGDFFGEVFFHNHISKLGGGFQIDHPLDPANKYLSHSFVESPDMKNIYDGMVVLDASGEAEIKLPDWFEALNSDFRYQLTCLGGYAPVYIAGEIHDHSFTIAGGRAGMKISWQVTGTRQDAWANAHRVRVEIEKPVEEQGYYLAPELHGESKEKSIRWARYPQPEGPRLSSIQADEGSDVLPSREGRSSPPHAELGNS